MFEDSFMQPDIFETIVCIVETSEGTTYLDGYAINIGDMVDADVDSDDWPDICEAIADYVDGEVYSIQFRAGYLGRLSAPGYMDCTDYTFADSYDEAMEELEEMYGDDC